MMQLYFLSIVFNGFAGLLFIFGDSREKSAVAADGDSGFSRGAFFFDGDGFRLILGILTAVTGILKLLAPVKGIPILGDLIPAVAGIAAGFILIFGFYRDHSSHVDPEEKINRFGETFLHYKKAAGFVLLASALLHFLFPGALFL